MIYDRSLTVYSLASGSSPLARTLTGGIEHYYAEKEVYASRYYKAMEAGESVDMLLELPRMDTDRITSGQYCVPDDGELYRIVQAQYGYDADGLPITTLSLKREGNKYDIIRDTSST